MTDAADEQSRLFTMRRVCITMLLGGGITTGIGVWTTQETADGRLVQSIVALALFAMCAAITALPAARRPMEAAAFASLVLLGVLIALSKPLGMAPTFALWPVVLLAHFSSHRVAAVGYATAVVAVGAGLLANTSAAMRVDTFVGTTASVGLMAWLVASLTRREARLRAELATAAETDPLTGLLNRRAFHPRLDQLVADAAGRRLTLVMFDIDHFKSINDRFGHAVGDDALRHVANALRATARQSDLVARLGGEEFAVVLPRADLDEGRRFAAQVANAIRTAPLPVAVMSTSAGVCTLDDMTTTSDDLLTRADAALYAAKAAGRGRSAAWEHRPVVDQPFAAA